MGFQAVQRPEMDGRISGSLSEALVDLVCITLADCWPNNY